LWQWNDEIRNPKSETRNPKGIAMSEPVGDAAKKGHNGRVYDLEERTARFGETVIAFAKRLPRNAVTLPLIGQLVRSGTSVGANYCEADSAVSNKDFRHTISISRKEARETMYWFRMIAAAEPDACQDARTLWREAKELHLIFSSIWRRKQ
jgi:four helix bundle protein